MLKPTLVYLAASLLCVLFNAVYAKYSHGVSSAGMTYMFIYPLTGGVVVCILFAAVRKLPLPGIFTVNSYNSGIAALTTGSCLKGVFEIAGTASPYQPLFMIAGVLMIIFAVASYFLFLSANKT
jgi:hypothetical protein